VTDLPEGFFVGDLFCFPYGVKHDATFGYIPGSPSIEVDADGKLKLGLMTSEVAGILSMEVTWAAPADAITAAQAEIGQRYPGLASPGLRVAELTDTTASVTVTGSDGLKKTFDQKPTSETSLYRTTFSETLKSTEQTAAQDALQGETGLVEITCRGNLTLLESVNAKFTGDVAEELKALAPKNQEEESPDLTKCIEHVDKACSAGRLIVELEETPNVSSTLRNKVVSALLRKVANELFEKIREMGEDAVYMSEFKLMLNVPDSKKILFSVTGEVDLANCVAGHDGTSLITNSKNPIAEPDH
jgi:hypothetical protein